MLRLSEDNEELQYWSKRRSSLKSISIPVSDVHGVVFGAYTCTFKKQKPTDLPPNWAAFSLIGDVRSFDFSARVPEVVECCVLGLQQIVWERRQIEKAQALATSAIMKNFAFEPWPPGFFLWMRLRFRLQEQAAKRVMAPDHMLWIVFMKCAFSSQSEFSKGRFINMAEKLQNENNFDPRFDPGLASGAGLERSGEIVKGSAQFPGRAKLEFQKERVKLIVDDEYRCPMHRFLPGAPQAVVGGCESKISLRVSVTGTLSCRDRVAERRSQTSVMSGSTLLSGGTSLEQESQADPLAGMSSAPFSPSSAGALLKAFDDAGEASGLGVV